MGDRHGEPLPAAGDYRAGLPELIHRRVVAEGLGVLGGVEESRRHAIIQKITRALNEYSDATVERLHRYFQASETGTGDVVEAMKRRRSEGFILTLLLVIEEGITSTVSNQRVLTGSLELYPEQFGEGPENYLRTGEHRKRQWLAVLTVVCAIQNRLQREPGDRPMLYYPDSISPRLASNDVVELIMERPQDADRIADIMIERRSRDRSLIETVLDHDESSLSGGLL